MSGEVKAVIGTSETKENSEDRVLMKIKKEKIPLASPFIKGGKRGIAAVVCFAVLVFNVSSLYAAWADHIVISEIATTSAIAKDEFVEIYNLTENSVNAGDCENFRVEN